MLATPNPSGALVAKIISGGQTGVDRAALDVALRLGIPCGGWCPLGRRAEDGPIPARYPLQETAMAGYPTRTWRNVLDADATLILARTKPRQGGVKLTQRFARELGKPCMIAYLGALTDPLAVAAWILDHGVRILNVAGPRESGSPGIRLEAARLLKDILTARAVPFSASDARASMPKAGSVERAVSATERRGGGTAKALVLRSVLNT